MRFRLADKRDFATGKQLLDPALGLSSRVLARIEDIWATLAAAGTFSIVEDPALESSVALQGFGGTVFVEDGFADDFVADGRTHLDAALYERIVAGRSPVLSTQAIAKANASDGLTLVSLHYCLRRGNFADPYIQRVLQTTSASFYFLHAGYRLKTIVNEVFDADRAAYMTAGGFRRHTDLSQRADPAQLDDRPRLFVMRREWIAPGAVHPLSFLFHSPTPQLGFSETEQRVLFHALLNRSDREIAVHLESSLDAVKKTWRRIYDRVQQTMPALIATGALASVGGGRSAEKRRHLLDYLRTHLEEVRPRSSSDQPLPRARRRRRG